MTTLVLALVFLANGTALGRPTIVPTPDRVVVIVPGVDLAVPTVSARGDRVEVPILAGPVGRIKVRVADSTVKAIRIYGGSRPRVSVQLRHGRTTTRRIAGVTTVAVIDGGIRIEILRDPAGAVAAPPPPAAPPAPSPGEPATAPPDPVPSTDVSTVAPATTAVTATAPVKPEATLTQAPESRGSTTGTVAMAILLIGACGAALWYVRRRRATVSMDDTLTIVATRQLGGKAKVVLLSTGARELLLAVGEKGPRLMAQWRCGDQQPSAARPASRPLPAVDATPSPAVAGLLRLRGKRVPISAEIATGDDDADAEWARELLAATGGRAA